jgi:hypothetical protein
MHCVAVVLLALALLLPAGSSLASPPSPHGLIAHFTGSGSAIVGWTQRSDANRVYITKQATPSRVVIGYQDGSPGPHVFAITNPLPGDIYRLEEWREDDGDWIHYGDYEVALTGMAWLPSLSVSGSG